MTSNFIVPVIKGIYLHNQIDKLYLIADYNPPKDV